MLLLASRHHKESRSGSIWRRSFLSKETFSFVLYWYALHRKVKKKKKELKCHIHFKITFEESCFLVIWYSRDQSYFSVLRKKTWKTKHFPWQVNVPTQMLRQQVPHKVKYHWIKAFSFLLLPFCPHTYSQILISKHLHILCTRFVFLLFPLWRVTLKVPQYNKLFSLKRKKKKKPPYPNSCF